MRGERQTTMKQGYRNGFKKVHRFEEDECSPSYNGFDKQGLGPLKGLWLRYLDVRSQVRSQAAEETADQ